MEKDTAFKSPLLDLDGATGALLPFTKGVYPHYGIKRLASRHLVFLNRKGASMSVDDEPVSLEACALPGTIKVTGSALLLAKRFLTAVPTGHIIAFGWCEGRRMKVNKDAPWIDQGPGLELGAYRTTQIPEEAVYRDGSFRYAVLIRKEVVDAHPEKTIDLDDGGRLILR